MFEGVLTGVLAQTIFVFILIFSLIYGILQRSKILGEGSKQTNALIALAIGLLVVSVGYALDLITKIVPVLAVGLVLILVFLLFIALFYEKEFKPQKWMTLTAISLAFVAVAITIIYYTGFFNTIASWFSAESSNWAGNIVLIIIVIIVFLIAFLGKDK